MADSRLIQNAGSKPRLIRVLNRRHAKLELIGELNISKCWQLIFTEIERH